MNRNIVWSIAGLFAIILLILTNPDENDHKAAVKAKMNSIVKAKIDANASQASDKNLSLGLNIGTLLGGMVLDKLIDASVSRTNYILFSTTNFTDEGKVKAIGIGVLGNVYLSKKVDNVVDEIKAEMNE